MSALPSHWLAFLHEHGMPGSSASHTAESSDAQHDSPHPTDQQQSVQQNFVAPLTHLGMLTASGEDAAKFLHAQLTNDIEQLTPAEVRLAGYCTAKGRMLASMLAWRDGDTITLQLPQALLPAIQKRLQMFVLRAKVKLVDTSIDRVAIGAVGALAGARLAEHAGIALPQKVHAKTSQDQQVLMRLPDAAGAPRYQWVTDVDTAMRVWPGLVRAVPQGSSSQWRRTEIDAGIPMIVAATQEKFVPQMINFELIGGVNFRKGCYPGQEIVARSQYLGKLKRRMLPAEVDAIDIEPGTEVYASTDPSQPSGQVVNAEPIGNGRSACLVELKTAVLDQGATLHLGAPDGAQLQLQSLPYPLTEPA